jgi:poly(hydroxyalkanoate) depolymerase family esterase
LNKSDDSSARSIDATPLLAAPRRAQRVDGGAITDTIKRAFAAAGLDTQTGVMKSVTDTIHQALSTAGLMQRAAEPGQHGVTIDGIAHAVHTPRDGTPATTIEPVDPAQSGEFITRSYTNNAGTRAYKLYVPARYSNELREPVPLIVMLHGCTQSPDDFAAGTRMNELAERHGFLVVYPAQAANANGAKCWNWFRSEDQERDRGEPSLIAGITREVASDYRIDARRIFVAGMSAGAAMAIVLGATYPDLYAAVGAHSGLAYGAAHDMPSAMGAMQGGSTVGSTPRFQQVEKATIPTIVFHGDRDYTVNARNGAAIVDQAIAARSDRANFHSTVREGSTSNGRSFTHMVFADAANQPVVESWVLHGLGHAWSGGSLDGSFTDAGGPDASSEMIRFFYSQLRAGTA